MTRIEECMSLELFKEILEKLPDTIRVLTLSGMGEMFLDPTIFTKISYAKALGYEVNALTNGSQMNSVTTSFLKGSGIDSIRISLHASDFDRYTAITGASHLSYTNVQYFLNHLPQDIYSILTVDMVEEDKEEVEKLRKMYEDKVDLLEIWKVHNWAGQYDFRKGERLKVTCGRPINGPLQIQVDGTINMCCFDFDGRLTLGDLKIQTVEEIFNSSMYKNIVAFHRGEEPQVELLCKNCDQLYETDTGIVIYNSQYGSDRIGKLSTTYQEMI